MRGSFDFIDRQVVSLIPERFNETGYKFDTYIEHIYFDGHHTTGTFEYYYGEYVEKDKYEYLSTVVFGRYRGWVDTRNSNKLYLTLTGTDIYFVLDGETILKTTLEKIKDKATLFGDLLGESVWFPRSFDIEMDFKTFISGNYKMTTDYGLSFNLFLDEGKFEELEPDN